MKTKKFNLIGLFCGMIGVVIIFLYGPPQPDLTKGTKLIAGENTVLDSGVSIAELEKEKAERREKHDTLSQIGLGFIGVGFLLQFIAAWIGKPENSKEA